MDLGTPTVTIIPQSPRRNTMQALVMMDGLFTRFDDKLDDLAEKAAVGQA
jgi:hypothetical protein